MNKRIVTFSFLAFLGIFLLAACQNGSLDTKTQDFQAAGADYQFSLPSGWEKNEEAKKEYNEAAVFGAVDLNSQSWLFIRTKPRKEVSAENFQEQVETTLSQYRSIKDSEHKEFKVGEAPALSYLFSETHQKKETLVSVSFILMEENIVEYQWYTVKNNSSDKKEQIFQQSMKSLEETKTTASTDSKSAEALNKVENDQMVLRISSYRVDTTLSKPILVLRYIYTNKTTELQVPEKQWQQMALLKQVNELTSSEQPSLLASDNQLTYLKQQGREAIGKGKSVESVAFYLLENSSEAISLTFDPQLFPKQEPIFLAISEEGDK